MKDFRQRVIEAWGADQISIKLASYLLVCSKEQAEETLIDVFETSETYRKEVDYLIACLPQNQMTIEHFA